MTRETSITAYHKIMGEGLLSRQRQITYGVLYDIGPATAGEVHAALKKAYGSNAPTNSAHARLGELRARGVARELGTRICSVTGQTVILWDVTRNLPVEPPKRERQQCKHCHGKGFIEQWDV